MIEHGDGFIRVAYGPHRVVAYLGDVPFFEGGVLVVSVFADHGLVASPNAAERLSVDRDGQVVVWCGNRWVGAIVEPIGGVAMARWLGILEKLVEGV